MTWFVIGFLLAALIIGILFNQDKEGTAGNRQNGNLWNVIRLKANYARIDSSYISDGLREAAKVVTFEETYQHEVPLDKVTFFFFHHKLRVVYSGRVMGGFDLRKALVVERNGRAEIELPEPEIFSNEILKRYTLQSDNSFTEEDFNHLEEKGKRIYEDKVYRELYGDKSIKQVRNTLNRFLNNMCEMPSYSSERSVPYSFEVIDKAIPITKNPSAKEKVVVDGSFRDVPERVMSGLGSRRLDYDSRYGSGVGRLTWDSRNDDDTYRRR